jgi:hypothetical protein
MSANQRRADHAAWTSPCGSAGNWRSAVRLAWAALLTGSRIIPLGDNGPLYHDLAARVRQGRG